MKKHTLIFLLLLLLSCSTNSGNSDSSTPPPPEPNQSELSKYAIGECSDFVKFDPHNLTFLNFLISKGYDLNKDSKISCDEAFKITMLDLGDSGYVTNLIGIESIKNLKILTGHVMLEINYPNHTGRVLNLYNNNSIEEVNFRYSQTNINNGQSYIKRSSVPTIVLPKNSNLKILNCVDIAIEKILNLSTQSNLKTLNLSSSGYRDELDLSGSSIIETLKIGGNYISAIKFSNTVNPYLKEVNLGNTYNINSRSEYDRNYITTINVGTFPNLEILYVANSNISNIDLSQNPKLIQIDISHNKFLNLDLSKNPKLIQIYASFNNLVNLDLSKNINISTLRLNNNVFSNLNTNDLANLTTFVGNNNLFENLDFSNNKKLNYIQLDQNDLKSLNLKNGKNTLINSLSAKQNNIDCIKVDNGFQPDSKKWFKDYNTKYCN